jgi:hypothetical protein
MRGDVIVLYWMEDHRNAGGDTVNVIKQGASPPAGSISPASWSSLPFTLGRARTQRGYHSGHVGGFVAVALAHDRKRLCGGEAPQHPALWPVHRP